MPSGPSSLCWSGTISFATLCTPFPSFTAPRRTCARAFHPLPQNLRDMMFMLGGTPRAVQASLAVPGQHGMHVCILQHQGAGRQLDGACRFHPPAHPSAC